MKIKNIYLTAIAAAFTLAACDDKIDPADIDSSTRIALSKDIPEFTSSGKTADGEDSYRAIVTVVHGDKTNDISWDYSLDDPKKCADVKISDIDEEFIGTYEGDSRTVTGKGVEIKVKANPEYKRSFTLTIKASDGAERSYTFTQRGDKADAEVSSDVKDIEFVAKGGTESISYTSNMGDEYSFSATYEGESKDWLTWEASEAGTVSLSASEWTNNESGRTAIFKITVGSDETSKATLEIPVTQLAADVYYYMYGASAAGLDIDDAIQMTKLSEGIYNAKAYFLTSSETHNAVLFNKDSRTLAYPCYALGKDGALVKIESATASRPQGLRVRRSMWMDSAGLP